MFFSLQKYLFFFIRAQNVLSYHLILVLCPNPISLPKIYKSKTFLLKASRHHTKSPKLDTEVMNCQLRFFGSKFGDFIRKGDRQTCSGTGKRYWNRCYRGEEEASSCRSPLNPNHVGVKYSLIVVWGGGVILYSVMFTYWLNIFSFLQNFVFKDIFHDKSSLKHG